jgi:hypothetical protein
MWECDQKQASVDIPPHVFVAATMALCLSIGLNPLNHVICVRAFVLRLRLVSHPLFSVFVN